MINSDDQFRLRTDAKVHPWLQQVFDDLKGVGDIEGAEGIAEVLVERPMLMFRGGGDRRGFQGC